MRKLLTCTTALSVALSSFSTLPARAQVLAKDGSVIGPDGTVLCVPTAGVACDLQAITEALAAAQAEAEAAAAAAAAAQAEAEAAVTQIPQDPAPEDPTPGAVAETGTEAVEEPAALPEEAVALPAEPVETPQPEPEAVESLADILAAPPSAEGSPPAEGAEAEIAAVPGGALAEAALPAAAAALLVTAPEAADQGAGAGAGEGTEAGTPGATTDPETPTAPDPIAVVTEIVSEAGTRTSSEEFVAAPVEVSGGRKSGLSDLEKVGLIALGALVVGTIINEGKKDQKEVVANSGDRVIVLNPDGTYDIYKDDDAVLRRPGVQTVTETYRDGSTRTVVTRADGTQVVTIRDASGRVLRRSVYDRYGIETVLIDDLYYEEPIIVSELPRPKPDRVTISTADSDAALKAELAAIEAEGLGRKFSLRQIRDIPEVRALAATIEVDSITFDTGSAAIRTSEARKLADLGRLMQSLLESNPAHVFLIEGHTDAVGSAASNLLLSDRRAESLALALTEYFDLPPENLVVQGYGEAELKIDTQGDERANRRVVVRLITPLMRTAELR